MTSPRRCLLIAPLTFYTFHHTVCEGLEARGYEVDLLNEEFPANAFGKILGKLALPILRRLTLRGLRARLKARPRYDLVVIIKGRGLGLTALKYLRSQADRIVGYNFDSFCFNPSPLDWHAQTDRYATFDIDDAAAYDLPLVPLFSAALEGMVQVERGTDLSVVMRVHSERLAYIDQVLAALPEVPKFVFLYESSYLTFALGFLRNPLLYMRLWKYISFKPLSYTEAMGALAASKVTLDYAHPQQSGITVRCFEAQSLGVAILSNNRSVVASEEFSPGATSWAPLGANPADLRAAFSALCQRAPKQRARILSDFLDDLLAESSADTSVVHGETT